MKISMESGCYFLFFALFFMELATSNPVNSLTTDTHDWTSRNCSKDQSPETIRSNEGDPFKLTCKPLDDCVHSGVYWIKQLSNGSIKSIDDSRITLDPEGTLWFSNITKLDATDDFYYACAVVLPSLHEYRIANRVLLDVISNSAISSSNKREPVKQYVSRKNVVALRGEKFELFCIYGGTPLPMTVWNVDGHRIQSNDRLIERNYGKSLIIKQVNFKDKGVYSCNVSNGVGVAQSDSFNLEVQSAPSFVRTPASADVAEDETVEFTCEADGVPEPKVEWTHKGRLLAEGPSNPRQSEQFGRLVFKNLKEEDAGKYGCNATNSHGYVYAEVNLTVLKPVPPKILQPPVAHVVADGSTTNMTCRVFGMPRPVVKWMRNGHELTGGRYEMMETGDLQIRYVSFVDASEYTCIASNKLGSANATGSLAVKQRTRVFVRPEDYEVAAGGTASFRCNAITDDTLPLQFEWLKNGESIDFELESRFLLGNDNSLRIIKTGELDSGTYTCVASTDLDEDRAQAILIVQDVPNPPILYAVDCGSNEAFVAWTPAGDNRSPILHYSIQYNTSFTPDTWDVIEVHVPVTNQSYAIPLSPWANYTFRVIAWNKIGPSQPSSYGSVCTTLPDVPYKNPDNVEGKGDDPHNLIIKWNIMPQIEHNAPKFMYRVYYKRDIPKEKWTKEDIHDWRTTQLRIDNLPTYQRYKIKVGAVNERGVSLKVPEEVVGFSGEDVPLQAPNNFTLEEVSSTTALLSWTKVPDEMVRGELRGYKIEIRTDEDGEEALREVCVNGADKTYALLSKLVPYSKHYARIRVYNGRYDGPASQIISFETPEGVPDVVTGLDVRPVGSSALMLKWNKPIKINGILTGYKITYQITGSEIGLEMERRINDSKATSAKLSGLNSQGKYCITIRATTNAGEGEPYSVEKIMPAPRHPDKPTFRWYNYNIPKESGLTNLKIIWDMRQEGFPGSYFFTKYRLVGEKNNTETDPEMESNEINIDALKSGLYIVSIVAVDGTYYAESDPRIVDVKNDRPVIETQIFINSSSEISELLRQIVSFQL